MASALSARSALKPGTNYPVTRDPDSSHRSLTVVKLTDVFLTALNEFQSSKVSAALLSLQSSTNCVVQGKKKSLALRFKPDKTGGVRFAPPSNVEIHFRAASDNSLPRNEIGSRIRIRLPSRRRRRSRRSIELRLHRSSSAKAIVLNDGRSRAENDRARQRRFLSEDAQARTTGRRRNEKQEYVGKLDCVPLWCGGDVFPPLP